MGEHRGKGSAGRGLLIFFLILVLLGSGAFAFHADYFDRETDNVEIPDFVQSGALRRALIDAIKEDEVERLVARERRYRTIGDGRS